MYAALGYSQRYTGWGRGLDWYGRNHFRFLDYICFFLILVIIIIGGIFTLVEKIKEVLKPSTKDTSSPKNVHTESSQDKIIKPTTPIIEHTAAEESSCSRKMPLGYPSDNPLKVFFTSPSKNLGVLELTNEQKCALFGIIFMMSSYKSLEKNKIKAFKIAKEFADDIKLNKEDYIRISSQLSFPSRYDYSNIIKGIESNVHINMMFAAWRKLVSLDNDNSPVFERLKWMCRELHLSKEEYQKVINGKSL